MLKKGINVRFHNSNNSWKEMNDVNSTISVKRIAERKNVIYGNDYHLFSLFIIILILVLLSIVFTKGIKKILKYRN